MSLLKHSLGDGLLRCAAVGRGRLHSRPASDLRPPPCLKADSDDGPCVCVVRGCVWCGREALCVRARGELW